MSIIEKLRINAGKKNKSIIFSDGNDERTIKAAHELISNKLCRPSLIGDREYIMPIYSKLNPESDLDIIDINNKSYTETLAAHYYEKRKSKGETMESALEAVKRPCY
ncbi:MAG: phosphate acetyltransferase, partial [Mucispirillum sp.]|nr:phosphate acetyltransferase [Mucispirillum sp.]